MAEKKETKEESTTTDAKVVKTNGKKKWAELGAIWRRESGNGKKFLNVGLTACDEMPVFEIDGKKFIGIELRTEEELADSRVFLPAFENENKGDNEKAPDFRLVRSPLDE